MDEASLFSANLLPSHQLSPHLDSAHQAHKEGTLHQTSTLNRNARRGQAWHFIALLIVCLAAIGLEAPAQTFVVLHQFTGTDGSWPNSLVQGLDGKFYGTTELGGTSTNCQGSPCGTFFKIGRYGKVTRLYEFCTSAAETTCPDGALPTALVMGPYGTFYGTAWFGGTNGAGTVFKFAPDEPAAPLYSFCSVSPPSNCTDGSGPTALVWGWDGSLHGTTEFSSVIVGSGNSIVYGGRIFRLSTGGKIATQYNFCSQGCLSEVSPRVLIQGADGNFYGVTLNGGTNGAGTVFRIGSKGFETLYQFCSQDCTDGVGPNSLILGSDGDLYGTTMGGGDSVSNPFCSDGCGTVFKITTAGVFNRLYSFSNSDPGIAPDALVQGTDGNLYGTTTFSPVFAGNGAIFKITTGGTLTWLHNFSWAEGHGEKHLVQGTDGAFYGAAAMSRGPYGNGTVFRLDVGLGPFVRTVLTFGKVGDRVSILGTDLTGATAVSFNGTPATFRVVGCTLIAANVPAGATTGTVTVTTPTGTLTSNAAFTVLP